MQKATLTPTQRTAALVAGIVGHLLFGLGWTGLGIVGVVGVLTLVLGSLTDNLGSLWGESAATAVESVLGAGVVVGAVLVAIAAVAVVLVVVGIVVSWLILRRGTVRKPGAVTWSAVAIAAALDIPLFWIVIAITANLTDSRAAGTVFFAPVIGLVAALVVGALVWRWMTWAFRGPASVFAGTNVTAAGTGTIVSGAGADAPERVDLEELLEQPRSAPTPTTDAPETKD